MWTACHVLCFLLVATSISIAQTATETAVYTFCGASPVPQPCTDGYYPHSKLVQGSDGNFYGTTPSGGEYGEGTIFRIANGIETILYSFSAGQIGYTDGSVPYGGLIQASDWNFYGVTYGDGSVATSGPDEYTCVDPGRCGTVFKFDALDGPTSIGLTTLHTFCAEDNTCSDGYRPYRPLVQGSDGNLYGTTALDNVFKISLTGTFTSLITESDFQDFLGSFVQGSDGNFYAPHGGGGTNGTILQLVLPNTLNTIYSFTGGTDGQSAEGALVEGKDGDLYGTSIGGGASGEGTVFKVSPSGTFTVLANFCDAADTSCHDGYDANGDLFLASDGNFYESTEYGGLSGDCSEGGDPSNLGCGEIVEISSAGILTDLYSFTGASDGANPLAGLIQASDGNFYGTATGLWDTNYSYGNVYEIALSPSLAAPVQLSIKPSLVPPGKPVTASLKVLNAFSLTMQQCYGYATSVGVTTRLGKVPGTYNSTSKLYTFSAILTPTQAGT
jgi:uncharacterized repeat protein (TIGR03803 family)